MVNGQTTKASKKLSTPPAPPTDFAGHSSPRRMLVLLEVSDAITRLNVRGGGPDGPFHRA